MALSKRTGGASNRPRRGIAAAAMAAASLVVACGGEAGPSAGTTQEEAKATASSFVAALRAGDDDAACQYMSLELRKAVVEDSARGTCQEVVGDSGAIRDSSGRVRHVSVEGSTATATVRPSNPDGESQALQLVRLDGAWRVDGFQFLPSVSGREATLWAVGDGADGRPPGVALAEHIGRSSFDRFLYLGDVYERGSAEDFDERYASTYGRIAGKTAPTLGNHESHERSTGYFPYWRGVHGQSPPAFYSFDAGGWQILSLNSEAPSGAAQLDWLKGRLRGRGTCRLAFWHRPRYSAGPHGAGSDIAPLWSALRGRASIVVNAHDHNMQRFRPRGRITQFVSGAGGHGLHSLDDSYPGLEFGNDRDYGALRLELRPGSASYAFVTADGRRLDAGRIACDRR